jgi:hypothetical protein
MHVPASPGRCRTTRRCRDALRNDPERGGRHTLRAVQAHRAFWWLEHVSRPPKSPRKRDEAAVSHARA